MERITTGEGIPNWIRPDIEKERGEIARVAKEFLGKEPSEAIIQEIIRILDEAPIMELSDEDWALLENTDSFHDIRPGHIEDAEGITTTYNQELPSENKRDFQGLLKAFSRGNPMQAPTILKNDQGKLHLVSGNTRLMIARALKMRPKVIIGEVSKM